MPLRKLGRVAEWRWWSVTTVRWLGESSAKGPGEQRPERGRTVCPANLHSSQGRNMGNIQIWEVRAYWLDGTSGISYSMIPR